MLSGEDCGGFARNKFIKGKFSHALCIPERILARQKF